MTRQGFSLMEVILATAILLASVVVLSELASIGRQQSDRATIETRAQETCERTLNELLLGQRPLVEVQDEPLLPPGELIDERPIPQPEPEPQDDQLLIFSESPEGSQLVSDADALPEWLYSVRIELLEQHPGLAQVSVTVIEADSGGRRPVRFRLSRWIERQPASEFAEPGSAPFAFPGAAR